jgi:hypothetical protein
MSVERASTASSLIDVLDRVLDKGIVIDAWVSVCLVAAQVVQVEVADRLLPSYRTRAMERRSRRRP